VILAPPPQKAEFDFSWRKWIYDLYKKTESIIDAESVLNNRNDIINGKFRIGQDATSFAAPADGAYDLDGWQYGRTTSAVVTISRENNVITSPAGNFYRRLLVTTADTSIAAGDVVRSITKIEGYEALKYVGNTFTIGFRVRATVTGVHCIAIRTNTKTYVEEYTISATNTWEYKTITIVGGLENDLNSITNAAAVEIRWVHACGATYHTTAGTWRTGEYYATSNQVNDMSAIDNVFDLTDVSINLGSYVSVALTSHEDELRRCQRYFVKGETRSVGYASGANQSLFFSVDYPVAMLYSPTVTTSVGTTTNTGTTYTALTSSATRFSGNVLSSGSGNTAATLSFSASARL
jgi:hypothetical protein